MSEEPKPPSPLLLFETLNAYQRTGAIQAAIELDLFTGIAEGADTPAALAERTGASERGIRIVCDFLTICGFLTKQDGRYSLTRDTAVFLDSRSPAYMGGAARFLLSPTLMGAFQDFTSVVRKGGTTLSEAGTMDPDHPVWVDFARAMVPLMAMPARHLPELVSLPTDRPVRVLDVAAGHGIFGIAFAQKYPNVEVTGLDWARVLDVARENAEAAGVADRYRTLEGSAFDVDYGGPYDLILLTNFLHHFDVPTCETLLRKVHAALAEGGRAITLEFVPNEDRVSPSAPAAFALTMLASTAHGDAYPFSELDAMFRNAGFSRSEIAEIPGSVEAAVISYR